MDHLKLRPKNENKQTRYDQDVVVSINTCWIFLGKKSYPNAFWDKCDDFTQLMFDLFVKENEIFTNIAESFQQSWICRLLDSFRSQIRFFISALYIWGVLKSYDTIFRWWQNYKWFLLENWVFSLLKIADV